VCVPNATPRPFTPPEQDIRYPLYKGLNGPQGRSGRVRKILPPTGIRFSDHLARSESLYRLRYPGNILVPQFVFNIYKVVQIWPGLFVCKQVTVCPGHIWTTWYNVIISTALYKSDAYVNHKRTKKRGKLLVDTCTARLCAANCIPSSTAGRRGI
jgi:hypothetical protein